MLERRDAVRLPLKAKLKAQLVGQPGASEGVGTVYRGWSQDVSFGGLRLTMRKVPPLNAMVDLDIACTRPIESYRLRGQVGWHCREGAQTYVVGIFVREPSKERLVAWRRMLERRGLKD